MEKLSYRIANLLLKKQYIEESMYDIYRYGMQMTLEIGFSFFTCIIICHLLGMLAEGLIFFLIFIPLRSYLGGVHMEKYWTCFICSCITLIVILEAIKMINPDPVLIWFSLIASIIYIFVKAKVNKDIDLENAQFFKKVCSILLLIVIVGVVLSLMGDFSTVFLMACTCILVAVSKMLEREYKM